MRSRNKEKSPYITLEEACKLLEISIATGRNWLKLEKIKYSDPDKGLFARKDIEQLHDSFLKKGIFSFKKALFEFINVRVSNIRQIEYIKLLINFCINKLDATTHVIYLLMPLAEGDFSQEVIKHKSHRNFTYIDVARELIATLATMQRENICHRDIKPQNILYLDEHSMIEAQKFCLCDFDEVIQIKSSIVEKIKLKVKGTEMFMSPILYKAFKNGELFAEHNPYKSDVYSLGLCFVYAITKSYNYLYRIRDNSDEENKIFLSKYLDNQEINEELIDLVEMMIKSDERDRLDFIQLEKYLQSNTYEL